jgi:mitochondrial fission protein ELM1
MENQCLGLAEALGLKPEVKRVAIRAPWRWLPPFLQPWPLLGLSPAGDRLAPPWPDILIACGKQVAAPAAAIRKASGGKTFTLYIQNPQMALSRFDLVVAPEHDRLEGPNVIATLGGLNRLTPERLAQAAEEAPEALKRLERPRVAVMIGGPSKVHKMTPEIIKPWIGLILMATAVKRGSLMVTTSRRTGEANKAAIEEALGGHAGALYLGEGPNPYFHFLALADILVVTSDSVNMACEAAATGKPVHLIPLPGGSPKFERFHKSLLASKRAFVLDGQFESWDYEPLQETRRVAALVKERLQDKGLAL